MTSNFLFRQFMLLIPLIVAIIGATVFLYHKIESQNQQIINLRDEINQREERSAPETRKMLAEDLSPETGISTTIKTKIIEGAALRIIGEIIEINGDSISVAAHIFDLSAMSEMELKVGDEIPMKTQNYTIVVDDNTEYDGATFKKLQTGDFIEVGVLENVFENQKVTATLVKKEINSLENTGT